MPNVKYITLILLAVATLLPWRIGVADQTEPKLALIFGNSGYEQSPLRNPRNDAHDMANVLEGLGFEVMLKIDSDRRQMHESIRTFGDRLKKDKGVGLFYYAGHGVQVNGTNYLIPVKSPIEREDEVEFNSINVGSVLAKMQSANNALNIIMLDACRNNPFEGSSRTALNRGLARIKPPGGSVVMYSAGEGEVASDGDGRNGTFTHHLLAGLNKPGMSLRQLIYETRVAVHQETKGDQLPWVESSLLQDFIFSASGIEQSVANTPIASAKKASDDNSQVAMITPEPTATIKRTIGTLVVNAQPEDALVRIMNIAPRYKPGISLKLGKQYDILVSKAGYEPWREMVYVDDARNQIDVQLNLVQQEEALPGFIALNSGTFNMGCSEGDRLCTSQEKSSATISVQPVYIAEAEVTVGEFKAFVADSGYVTDAEKNAGGFDGCYIWKEKGGISRSYASWEWSKSSSWKNPGFKQTDQHPVTCVSWNDATAYTDWLSRNLGHNARLPTEAEWEFAARAGTTGRFADSKSDSALCTYANGADKSASPGGSRWTSKIKCRDGYWFTAPVKSFKANTYGLHDMLGNVREWTADVWTDQYKPQSSSKLHNTQGDAAHGVLRGGGWEGATKYLRVSARNKGIRNSRAAMTGFRVAVDATVQAAR